MSDARQPLSPHLLAYRWQVSSVLSILHRATGLALLVAAPLFVLWLLAIALGEWSFAVVQVLFGSWPGRIALFGFAGSLAYHLFNGLRHLVWDLGFAFERENILRGGLLVLAASGCATLLAVFLAWAANG